MPFPSLCPKSNGTPPLLSVTSAFATRVAPSYTVTATEALLRHIVTNCYRTNRTSPPSSAIVHCHTSGCAYGHLDVQSPAPHLRNLNSINTAAVRSAIPRLGLNPKET